MSQDFSKEIKSINDAVKSISDGSKAAAKEVKDLKTQQAELKKKIDESSKSYDKALVAIKNYTNGSYRGIEQIIQSTGRLNADMLKLSHLSQESHEYLVKKNKQELEANSQQLTALSKNIEKQKEQLQMHDKRTELIVEEGLLAKVQIEQEYRLLDAPLKNNEDYELRIVQLHEDKQKKIAAIDEDTSKKVTQNAVDMQMLLEEHSKASIDKVIEHSGEAVKHTEGFWKGVLDVGAQKEHLDTVKEQYKGYLDELKTFGEERKKQYQAQIDATYDVDRHNQLIAERNAFEEKHNKFLGEETKRINGELEKTEKGSQALRLEQWKNHAANAEKITKKISEITAMGATAVSNMFKQQAEMYKDQVAKIDEEIAANKTDAYERTQDFENNKEAYEATNRQKQEEIDAETIKMGQALTEEKRKESEDKIEILKSEIVTAATIEADKTTKEAKLENDKRKAQEKQKKAERNQKRVDLGQQIVAAVADIAAGVAKALGLGPFIGPIMASIVGAAGAVQVGIMTKQLAKLEDGGLLSGKRHSQGGMRIQGSNIEVEGGEYVVNRKTTQKNLGLMDYINSQHKELTPSDINSYFSKPFSIPTFTSPFSAMMEQGGQVPMLPLSADVDTKILNAIEKINFQPRVSVTDINTVQENMTRVDEWTGI